MKGLLCLALLCQGCAFGYRIGLAATVDGSARPGAAILIGGTIGPAGRYHHAVLFSAVADGAVVDTKKPVIGEFRVSLPVEWMVRWQHIAFRVGGAVGISEVAGDYKSRYGALLGGRLAILPAVRTRGYHDPHCGADTSQLHVGVAGSADYEWSAHRPLFMVGPTFEGYYYGFCG